MFRAMTLLVLLTPLVALRAETPCYALYDAAGNKLYQDETAPFPLAWPPPSAEAVASRARGEHLVAFPDRDCGMVSNPLRARRSGAVEKAAPAERLAQAVSRWQEGRRGHAYVVAESPGALQDRPRLARLETGPDRRGAGSAPLSIPPPIISIFTKINGSERHHAATEAAGPGLIEGSTGPDESAALREPPAAAPAANPQADLLQRMAKGDPDAIRAWLARESEAPAGGEAERSAQAPGEARAPAAEPAMIDFETAEKLAIEEEKERSRWWIFRFSPDRRRITERALELLGQPAAAPGTYKTREEVFDAYRAGRISREETLRQFRAMAGG